MGYWRLQNIPFLDQLKEVTIDIELSNGIQFAKYVLERAQNLRKIRKSMMTSSFKVVILEDQERDI
ncbi:unnamed protein product [Prunus armeniaca]